MVPDRRHYGTVVVSIVLLHQIANPTSSFWTHSAVRFGATFWVLTTSLNMLVTGTILGKIWLWRRFIYKEFKFLGVKRMSTCSSSSSKVGGSSAHTFGGPVAILLESAALSLVVGVFFLIVYVKNSIVMNVMMPVQGQVIVSSHLVTICSSEKVKAETEVKFFVAGHRTTAYRVARRPRERVDARDGRFCVADCIRLSRGVRAIGSSSSGVRIIFEFRYRVEHRR